MRTSTPLIGTWSLIDWYNQTDTGQRLHPLGTNATGYISYSQDGFVFVHLMASDRVLFAENDPFGGTVAEEAAAFKTQITYAGRYEYHGDHVIHHVTQASFPNWIGTDQVRQVEFIGRNLRLSAENAAFQGQKVTAFVEWKRATT
ncbi:lipocalin-like domain-containing protein [Rhodobacteraceae bacterium B1Z28]|uniref:Lipocalin-like domain-containing protein n=1 Tax=Ruegeria haliotis TaxID=2747601 RepID=A0ABX2PQ61_9RHOB|nr:lipocalin-like domain-containing protein [Ruegeria haliotis]NVO55551.1 lipocalin-like domain-containing protein [Ruegeria haliotis]